jgi:hypothetical protein
MEAVAPVDRTPVCPWPNQVEKNPVDISAEQLKFIQDHGSSLLSEEFYTMLYETASKTLLPLIADASGRPSENPRDPLRRATWLRCPLDAARQHVSDFGRIAAFDAVLVTITTERRVWSATARPSPPSAARATAPRSSRSCRTNCAPLLLGADAREIGRLWGRMYNGVRAPLAERSGRAMPVLGRRGIARRRRSSGVDLALWDLAAKLRNCSRARAAGRPCRDRVPAYASGGWAPADRDRRRTRPLRRCRASAPSRCASARWTAASTQPRAACAPPAPRSGPTSR